MPKIDLDTFNKLTDTDLILSISVLVSTLCCGAISIFLYDKQLFLSLETAKLILLSVAITAPVLSYNSFVYLALYPRKSATRGNIAGGGFVTIPVFSVAILGRYFLEYSGGVFISVVIFLELVFTVIISFEFAKKYS